MKPAPVWLPIFLTVWLLAGSSQAKLPELDAVYYGTVAHKTNQPLVPDGTTAIVVVAKLNGIAIATSTMAASQNRYVLKVPRDDGLEPRLNGTTRAGERIRVYLRKGTTDYEVKESVANSATLSVSSAKGGVQAMNFSVDQDLGGASFMSAFITWAAGYGLASTPNLATQDPDGDLKTNLEEFVAGTNPTAAADSFGVLQILRANGVTSIKFGPVMPNRRYAIYSSDTAQAGSWTQIGEVLPDAAEPYRWFDHVIPGTAQLFYSVEVSLQ